MTRVGSVLGEVIVNVSCTSRSAESAASWRPRIERGTRILAHARAGTGFGPSYTNKQEGTGGFPVLVGASCPAGCAFSRKGVSVARCWQGGFWKQNTCARERQTVRERKYVPVLLQFLTIRTSTILGKCKSHLTLAK